MSTLTINEAAERLGLSAQRVRQLCKSGLVEASLHGRAWVITEQAIDRYIRESSSQVSDHPTNLKASDKPIALSFFSGAMGLDLGLEKAGFEVRLACEVDKYCRQTIERNKPDVALLSDISDYCAKDIRDAAGLSQTDDIDLVAGGPPCQAFSTAGKRKAFEDERGNVFLKYIELALELSPKYIVIENVRGLLSCPMSHRPHNQRGEDFPDLNADELKGGALNFVLSRLKKSGYACTFELYNAANFGSPQIRERVIIVCSRDGLKPPYLTPTHSADDSFELQPWRTFREAVAGIKTCHHLNFPEKRLKYYRMLEAGQNWRSLSAEMQKEALGKSYYSGGGKTGFLRRLAWNKPSPTLVTHPAMPATDLAHPEEDRPLSIEEYKRLQEFPDDWVLEGPLLQQYKQVGNAVPVSLGCAVGTLIKNLLEEQHVVNPQGFKYSRYKHTNDETWSRYFESLMTKTESLKSSRQNEIIFS